MHFIWRTMQFNRFLHVKSVTGICMSLVKIKRVDKILGMSESPEI